MTKNDGRGFEFDRPPQRERTTGDQITLDGPP